MERAAVPATRDRRLDLVIAALAVLLILGGLARVVYAQRAFVAQHPQNLLWIALALAAGSVTFLANGAVALRGRTLLWAGYGSFAMLAGFNLQGLVNGTITRAIPAPGRGVLTYLALGFGAGLCQTFGKWLMIRVLNRVHRPTLRADVLAAGLAVGLGFGLSEVLFIGSHLIQAETAITGLGLVGVWERTAAVAFHIYSAGLIALGIALRRAWPIVAVLLVHSLEDWLAGAVSTGQLAIPIVALETIYTAATLLVWALFRRGARTLPD